ncbi:MAG: type I secretion C-terminal target domain-containing protein [Magnetococcus sp. YQC-9]
MDGVEGDISYLWYADGSEIFGATDRTYQLTQADLGKTISVRAIYFDDLGNYETQLSDATPAAVEGENQAPVVTTSSVVTHAENGFVTYDSVEELIDSTWSFGRSDGSTIASQITLRADGVIEGYNHNNEDHWGVGDGHLIFYSASNQVMTEFDIQETTADTTVLRGVFDGVSGWHVLTGETRDFVTTAQAYDPNGDAVTWSITGEDAASFVIDPTTGALSFQFSPDYEVPRNAEEDNSYRINLIATDSEGLASVSKAVTVLVTNISDIPNSSVTFAHVTQFANAVEGVSSEYTDTGKWCAEHSLGHSDTFGYGDILTSWASLNRNGNPDEYLSVSFEQPVHATGATIRETWGNGFVTAIDLLDVDGIWHTNVWAGTDLSQPGKPVDFTVNWDTTGYLVQGLKVHVDTDHDQNAWEEIDSIRLHSTVLVGQTLSAQVHDPDGVDGAVHYKWYADGVLIQGATQSTFEVTEAQVAKGLAVETSYTDEGGHVTRTMSLETAPVVNVPGTFTVTHYNDGDSFAEDAEVVDLTDIVITDADPLLTFTASLTLSNSNAGSLTTATVDGVTAHFSFNQWTATGDAATVNALLAQVAYIPADNWGQSFTIQTSIANNVGFLTTGSKAMTGTEVDDAPIVHNLNSSTGLGFGSTFFNLPDLHLSDIDSTTVKVTLTLPTGVTGTFSTETSGSVTSTYESGVWTADGAIVDVNTLLAGVTLTLNSAPIEDIQLAVSVNDGQVTGSLYLRGAIIGTSGNDILTAPDDAGWTLRGQYGNDKLIGGAGNDTLEGGYGNDILIGGAGTDTLVGGYLSSSSGYYYYDYGADLFVVGPTSEGSDLTKADVIKDFETERYWDGGYYWEGGYGAWEGGDLIGLAGDLTLGDIIWAQDTSSHTVNTAHTILSLNSGGPLVVLENVMATDLTGMHFIRMTDTPLNVMGTNGNDTLIGGQGNDVITGMNGSDAIQTGAGDDQIRIEGKSGDAAFADRVDGGMGNDTLTIAYGSITGIEDFTTRSFSNGIHHWTDGSGNTIEFSNIENIEFGDIVYHVVGYYGGDDIDYLYLGAYYYSTDTNKVYLFDIPNSYEETNNFNAVTYFPGVQTGIGIVGTGENDLIWGTSGADSITTEAGRDFVRPGEGADTVRLGLGDDIVYLEGRERNDTLLDGGEGIDWLHFGYSGQSTTQLFDLQHGVDSERIINFENIFGSLGTDHLRGDTEINEIRGSSGSDLIEGLGGNDILYGDTGPIVNYSTDLLSYYNLTGWGGGSGDGDDTLNGGTGSDTLTGGGGSDTFVIDANVIGTINNQTLFIDGTDTITDFDVTKDVIDVKGVLAGLGYHGGQPLTDGWLQLVEEESNTLVQLDVSGTGTFTVTNTFNLFIVNNVTVATLTPRILPGIADQTLDGSANNDSLTGGLGNDTLNGLAGYDRLEGGYGDDLLIGGDGHDSYYYNYYNYGGLYGGAGNDQLYGGNGYDELYGGSGNDLLDGGSDGSYDDLSGEEGNDTLVGRGDLYGGAGDDFIRGSGSLQGGDGDDQLLGGDGNDYLYGNAGSDILTGGAGFDRFEFNYDAIGNEYVRDAQGGSRTVYHLEGSDRITDFNPLEDTLDLSDVLYDLGYTNGNPFGDGWFKAEAVGNDTVIRVDVTATGHVTSDSPILVTLEDVWPVDLVSCIVPDGPMIGVELAGGADNDELTGGSGNDALSGQGGADNLDGNSGDDQLHGDSGNDSLNGGEGNDTLYGGFGRDNLRGDNGDDILDGGGLDWGDYSSNFYSDTLYGGNGNDTLVGIGSLYGESGIDVLSGSGYLYGGNDNDTITGHGFLYGEAGNDTLEGGAGDDLLSGGAGTDTLAGGTGADLFIFESYSVTSTWNSTLGKYVYTSNGSDTITDFGDGDQLDFASVLYSVGYGSLFQYSNSYLSEKYVNYGSYTYATNPFVDGWLKATQSGSDVQIRLDATGQNDFGTNSILLVTLQGTTLAKLVDTIGPGGLPVDQIVSGNGANNHLFGDTGNDTINGDAGNDVLVGVFGNDHLNGGYGQDDIYGGPGNDVLDGGPRESYSETLRGEAGNDTLTGYGYLYGGDGDDTLSGSGNLYGDNSGSGTGVDHITGSGYLYGEGGDDFLTGLGGDDRLEGGAGSDELTGGAGADTFDFSYSSLTYTSGVYVINGSDIITDFSAEDRLDISDVFYYMSGSTVTDPFGSGWLKAESVANDHGSTDVVLSIKEGATVTSYSTLVTLQNATLDLLWNTTGEYPVFVKDQDDTLVQLPHTLQGTVFGDSLNGSAGVDTLYGNAGADNLYARAGDDTLNGGAGGDYLHGEDGADTLFGGLGADTLYGDNGDDWLYGGDENVVEESGNNALYGGNGNDHLLGIGSLYGNDGNDALSGFGTLDGGAGDDTITGSGRLYAGDGIDTLIALNGDDELYASAGVDTLTGGGGADKFVIDYYALTGYGTSAQVAGADIITDFGVGDLIDFSSVLSRSYYYGSTALADGWITVSQSVTTPANAEIYLHIGGSSDPSTPQLLLTLNNVNGSTDLDLTQLYSGNLKHSAGSGSELGQSLPGTTAGEILHGNEGNDSISGGDGADTLYGDSSYDSLSGDAGMDTLYGGLGADSLHGGADNDQLAGGNIYVTAASENALAMVMSDGSNDTLYGDGGDDNLGGYGYLSGGDGSDYLFGSGELNGDNGNDQLYGYGTLRGGAGDDTLVAYDGDDILYGGLGSDTLTGGAGADSFRFDWYDVTQVGSTRTIDGSDVVTDFSTQQGDRLDLGLFSHMGYSGSDPIGDGWLMITETSVDTRTDLQFSVDMDGPGSDTTSSLVVTLQGVSLSAFIAQSGTIHNDTLTGTVAGDTIFGLTGNDGIYGGGGRDQLNGDSGDDNLYGEGGNDTLDGGFGNDYLSGGEGDDHLIGGEYSSYDSLYGGNGTDTLEGQGYLYGDAGDDTLTGGGTLSGGAGVDTLIGSGRLYGGSENDRLIGSTGNDELHGDLGSDILTGGAGNDTFIIDSGAMNWDSSSSKYVLDGVDIITDFSAGDLFDLRGVLSYWSYPSSGSDPFGDGWLGAKTGSHALDDGAGDPVSHNSLDIYYDPTHSGDFSAANTSLIPVVYLLDVNLNVAASGFQLTYSSYDEQGRGGPGVVGIDQLNLTVEGTPERDILHGGGGDDTIHGMDGTDELSGGPGDDLIDGGSNRYYYGNYSIEKLYGEAGNDTLIGGDGQEELRGGIGDDTLYGGIDGSWDYLNGDAGIDHLYGYGNIYGGEGGDFIGSIDAPSSGSLNGEDGNDTIYGSGQLFGNAGNDTLHGLAGDDLLNGGAGDDLLTGGAGADKFVFDGNILEYVRYDSNTGRNLYALVGGNQTSYQGDHITDFEAGDLLDLSSLFYYSYYYYGYYNYNGSNPFGDGWLDAIQDGADVKILLGAKAHVDGYSDLIVTLDDTDLSQLMGNILPGGIDEHFTQTSAGDWFSGNAWDTTYLWDQSVGAFAEGDILEDAGGAHDQLLFGHLSNEIIRITQPVGSNATDPLTVGLHNGLIGNTGSIATLLNDSTPTSTIQMSHGIEEVLATDGALPSTSSTLPVDLHTVLSGDHAEITENSAAYIVAGDASDNVLDLSGLTDATHALVLGGDGNDSLRGTSASDELVGGAGNDMLNGGAGSDILTGGEGADKFGYVAISQGSLTFAEADRITDFTPQQDEIVLAGVFDSNAQYVEISYSAGMLDMLEAAKNNGTLDTLARDAGVTSGSNYLAFLTFTDNDGGTESGSYLLYDTNSSTQGDMTVLAELQDMTQNHFSHTDITHPIG